MKVSKRMTLNFDGLSYVDVSVLDVGDVNEIVLEQSGETVSFPLEHARKAFERIIQYIDDGVFG